jgi:hypothetical protein
VKRLQTERSPADQVPVEDFKMSQIKDDPMPRLDRPFVESSRGNNVEDRIRPAPRFIELLSEQNL